MRGMKNQADKIAPGNQQQNLYLQFVLLPLPPGWLPFCRVFIHLCGPIGKEMKSLHHNTGDPMFWLEAGIECV